jgi:hypothetical protein
MATLFVIHSIIIEEGNDFFKSNLYKKAISSYGKSLAFTRGLPGNEFSIMDQQRKLTPLILHLRK